MCKLYSHVCYSSGPQILKVEHCSTRGALYLNDYCIVRVCYLMVTQANESPQHSSFSISPCAVITRHSCTIHLITHPENWKRFVDNSLSKLDRKRFREQKDTCLPRLRLLLSEHINYHRTSKNSSRRQLFRQ